MTRQGDSGHAATDTSDHRLLYRSGPLEEDSRLSGTAFPRLVLSFDEAVANLTVTTVE